MIAWMRERTRTKELACRFIARCFSSLTALACFGRGGRPHWAQGVAESGLAVRDQASAFRDCADCPEMVRIPAGSFTMGSPPDENSREADEGPQRSITLRTFAVSRFEVTRSQYAAFRRASGRAVGGNCATDLDHNGVWEVNVSGTGSIQVSRRTTTIR